MIEFIEIDRFKSIEHVRVELLPFTVLVGANGSGKSNFVKALAFLGAVSTDGLSAAVSRFGGINSLLPKTLSAREARAASVRLRYRVSVPRPAGRYPEDRPPATVEHELEFGRGLKRESVRVTREKLVFHHVMTVARALSGDKPDEDGGQELQDSSWFSVERDSKFRLSYASSPPVHEAREQYLAWLGLSWLKDAAKPEEWQGFMDRLAGPQRDERDPGGGRGRRDRSLLDPDLEQETPVALGPDYRTFRSNVRLLRRYDLLLHQLRSEQQVSGTHRLSQDGSNMPSVVRLLSSDAEDVESWNRLNCTLAAIAPHVVEMETSALGTGKEFVRFVEGTRRKEFDSWETSDGTLRALAILLALETSPPHTTILIEEPEQNLHPWAVRTVVDHLRQVVEEKSLQVITTTHSQQVLERAYPKEVLIALRNDQEHTEFRTLEQVLPHADIAMGEVGRLWVDGLLGGVPS